MIGLVDTTMENKIYAWSAMVNQKVNENDRLHLFLLVTQRLKDNAEFKVASKATPL